MTTPADSVPETRRPLASMIDHTILKPEAGIPDVERICAEARQYGFAAVCVNPALLPVAVRCLQGSTVAPCTVVGFPLGALPSDCKAFETGRAVAAGAREVDMVIALWALKQHDYGTVLDDMRAVVRAAGSACAVKVILETCLLTDDEKLTACKIALEAGVQFVKTSTGFSTGGATARDVALLRGAVGTRAGVKASGGIRSLPEALAMVKAGANRIGTSAGITIVTSP